MNRPRWLSTAKEFTQKLNPQHQIIRQKIKNDPYYRFQSLEEITIARELGIKIDVNQASVDDWLRLPGISIHQARILVKLVGMGVELLSIEDVAAALSVPVRRLKPLEPILDFCYYDPESLLNPQRINLNQAHVKQLEQLPFLSPTLAEQIIADRHQKGDYKNIVDFQQRLNLSGEIISQIMHYLIF
ncbi:ComEA family DNA-binding protein [Gloeothece citriformis]|nr:ComEA family DNA-binding protein [Gloeothece citriformis]